MNKKVYLFAAVAALFAACSNNDGAESAEKAQAQQNAQQIAVDFGVYTSRQATRAGVTGDIKTAGLKTDAGDLRNAGFGVFGYYTNADSYDQTFTPNFMYNQQVTSDGTDFSYTPVKYWPNEYGGNAYSEDVDKVSFFAYAPWVKVNVATGKLHSDVLTADATADKWGITGMTRNTASGDPMVKYISTFATDKQVDLVWGTQTGTWNIKQTSAAQSGFTAGLPWLNVQHPQATGTTQRLTFDFKHALAALNVQVDLYADATTATAAAAGTKVFIRSVTFEGFDTKGALNLNNTTADKALWYNYDCNNEIDLGAETLVQDGRKDGKEGVTAAGNENALINPTFVQSDVWGSTAAGVTNTAGNLFCKTGGTAADDAADAIYVIPNGDELKVTIEYDVLTADGNLSGKLNDGQTAGSVVKNVITRYITSDGTASYAAGGAKNIKLTNGKKYKILLHLGLNSVEFDASVTTWTDPADPDGSANLPNNN